MPSLANMNNIFSQLMGGGNTSAANTNSSSTSTSASTQQQQRSAAGLFNSGAVQDVMQQMLANPGQLESIMNAPYMQSMIQSMASNPEMTRMLVENNPQLANNPEMREQVTRALPNMMSQVRIVFILYKDVTKIINRIVYAN